MKKEVISKILNELKKDLEMKNEEDYIGELFEDRAETIHGIIMNNKMYKEQREEIYKIEKEIQEKYKNHREIIQLIEKHENVIYDRSDMCEKLMYKYGVYEGMSLIINGINQKDITELAEENKQEM